MLPDPTPARATPSARDALLASPRLREGEAGARAEGEPLPPFPFAVPSAAAAARVGAPDPADAGAPTDPPDPADADRRFALLGEAIVGFLYDADVAAGTVARVGGMALVTGWRPDEVPATVAWWRTQMHPADVARLDPLALAAAGDARCATYDHEYRVRHRDGYWVWVNDRARLVRDAAGQVVRIVGLTTDATARRARAMARAEADRRFRLLIEQSPTSTHVVGMDGRTVQVNPAFTALWGLTADDLRDYVLWDDPQIDANGQRPFLERARAGEPVHVPPYRFDAAASVGRGSARHIEVTVFPVKDEGGRVRELVLQHADVTERAEAEAALRASEARLARVLETTPSALVEFDAGLRLVWANAAAEGLLGRTRAELAGLAADSPGWAVTTPEGAPLAREALPVVRALHGETVAGVEVATAGSAGPWRVFSVNASPVRDADGAVTGVLAAFEDVTARHRAAREREALLVAEHEARERAERRRQRADFLAEASRMLADSLDYEATLQAVAGAAVPALGDWCAVDMLATPHAAAPAGGAPAAWPPTVQRLAVAHEDPAKVAWAHALHARVPPEWDAPTGMPRVLREGVVEFYPEITPAMLEAAARTPEELALLREIGFSAFLCVPLVARGQVLGALTLCHTESGRRYDDEDRALAEDLARRAAVAVDNARLFRDALVANQAKSQFLAVMSHELRTPLNAIGGHAQLVELGVHGPIGEAQREAMGRIQRAQAHLLTLINDILHFAKLEAGAVRLREGAVPVAEAVGELRGLVEPQAAAKGLTLDFPTDGAAVRVRADRDRLQQVLLNLLGNAIKFTAPGGRVAIDWEVAGAEARVHVRDTGIGIPADRLASVFDPFVQIAVRVGSREGVGLGLAISRELARAMGGDLHAASTEGAGSTFTLVLPLDASDGTSDARAA